ncbi:unnamed protein product, partial [Ectocarpus sp. 8 AP-2014]
PRSLQKHSPKLPIHSLLSTHLALSRSSSPRRNKRTQCMPPTHTLLSTHTFLLSQKAHPHGGTNKWVHACFAKNASHHLRLCILVVAMQGPGLGDGPLELVRVDVVHAHGR